MWHPYSTINSLIESASILFSLKASPKMLQHTLKSYKVSSISKKLIEDGLLSNKTFSNEDTDMFWTFKDLKVNIAYNYTMKFSKAWAKIRDGIRLIEKYVSYENNDNQELNELIDSMKKIRKELDVIFWKFF